MWTEAEEHERWGKEKQLLGTVKNTWLVKVQCSNMQRERMLTRYLRARLWGASKYWGVQEVGIACWKRISWTDLVVVNLEGRGTVKGKRLIILTFIYRVCFVSNVRSIFHSYPNPIQWVHWRHFLYPRWYVTLLGFDPRMSSSKAYSACDVHCFQGVVS